MHTAPRSAGYADREVTQPPNWHGLVVADVFLNAVATGLFLVAAVGELARPDLFAPVGIWAYPLALVLLLADLSCLVLDLGDPLRFHHMLRVFKPLSPMSLGTWCLTAYSLPLALLVALDVLALAGWLPTDSAAIHWLRVALLVVGLPFAFGSALYKGVLFSTTAQPGWRDARWLGAYHTGNAFVLGGAVLVLVCVLTGHYPALAVLRPALIALILLNVLPFAFLNGELQPAMTLAHPRRVRVGYVVAFGLGGRLIPLGLLLFANSAAVTVAAVLLLAFGWFARSLVVHLPHRIHAR